MIRTILDVTKEMAELFMPDSTTIGICFVLIVTFLSLSAYTYFWIHCKRLYRLNRSLDGAKSEYLNEESPIQTV